METLEPVLYYVIFFLLVVFVIVSFIFTAKHWTYDVFIISEDRVSFDIILGDISWSEKNHYRRHKRDKVWQRRVIKKMFVRKQLIGKGKLLIVYRWEDVSPYKNKKLERMIKSNASF